MTTEQALRDALVMAQSYIAVRCGTPDPEDPHADRILIEIQQQIDAALSQPQAAPAEAAWKFVPVEPTADMRNAYHAVTDDEVTMKGAAGSRWAAMLAASPSHPLTEWISLDDRRPPEPDDESDVPVWTWDGETVAEDEWSVQFEQPAGPCVGGWISTGYGFSCDGATRQATHWMLRSMPTPPVERAHGIVGNEEQR